jgi:MraZ protein
MGLTTGTFESTLDDKGRVSIPIKVREQYSGALVLTMGMERCVWVLTRPDWDAFVQRIEGAALSDEEANAIEHRHLLPAQEGELDKTGRIPVPQTLRRYARLAHDCLVISAPRRLEIWDADTYDAFLDENQAVGKKPMLSISRMAFGRPGDGSGT